MAKKRWEDKHYAGNPYCNCSICNPKEEVSEQQDAISWPQQKELEEILPQEKKDPAKERKKKEKALKKNVPQESILVRLVRRLRKKKR